MLRRYLIVNGTLTVLMYAAAWAFVPSVPQLVQSAQSTVKTLALDNPLLRPIVDRIVNSH